MVAIVQSLTLDMQGSMKNDLRGAAAYVIVTNRQMNSSRRWIAALRAWLTLH